MNKAFSILVIVLFAVFCWTTAHGQQETRLKASGSLGGWEDHFGYSVSTNGEVVIVGAPDDDEFPAIDVGRIYIFEREGTCWEQKATRKGDMNYADYGSSVSMDGDRTIVGAPSIAIDLSAGQGGAYLLERQGTIWPAPDLLVASDGRSGDKFGTSVSISGEYAIVGSPSRYSSGAHRGGAYMFKYNNSDGQWEEDTTFFPTVGSSVGGFGSAVSISGDRAIVGVPNDKIDLNDKQGSAYIYERQGESWIEAARLTADDGEAYDYFGQSVSIWGDYVAIGAHMDAVGVNGQQGSVYIYTREGDNWAWQAKLTASDGNFGDRFGSSVSLFDDHVIIGAPWRTEDNADHCGAAYMFKRDGSDWTLMLKLVGYAEGDRFGASVCLNGNMAVVGSPYASNLNGQEAGSATVYRGVTAGLPSATPRSLNFGDVAVGRSDTLTVEVENVGLEDLTVHSISLSGTNALNFAVDTAGVTLTPGDFVDLNVVFTPDALGTFDAVLQIDSDGGSESVTLIGNGSITLSVVPDTIRFGRVRVGEDTTEAVTVANIGLETVNLDSIEIYAIAGYPGTFNTDRTPFALAPDEGRTLEVTFAPPDSIDFAASLEVYSEAGADTTILIGEGFFTGVLHVAQDTIDFGNIAVGRTRTESLFVDNLGYNSLRVGPNYLTGLGAGNFQLDTTVFMVPEDHYVILPVAFIPNAAATFQATLHLDSDGGIDSVALVGVGLAEGILGVSPIALDYGDVPAGLAITEQVRVTNYGITDLNVGPITLTGPAAARFALDTSSFALAAGNERVLYVSFTPGAVGNFTATLNIQSDYGDSSIALKGDGIQGSANIETKVTASDAADGDAFGNSVSISGCRAIVGALDKNGGKGAAYIYSCDATGWPQQTKLTVAHDSESEAFGHAVGISGDDAIVGAPDYADTSGVPNGAAFIFHQSGSNWPLIDMLRDEDGLWLPEFGHSVAIDGDHAIVGAPRADVDFVNSQGMAYIFRRSGQSWVLEHRLTASDGASNYAFGWSVGISGDLAIVGTMAYGAYVFQRMGDSWYQRAKLLSDDYTLNDYFGNTVAIDGDRAIVGAIFKESDSQGAAYIFKRNGSIWSQEAKLTSSWASSYEKFGASLSISGDFALVGTEEQEGAYLFRRDGSSWSEQLRVTASDGQVDDFFGRAVDLDATFGNAIIGAYGDYIASGIWSGSAYIYSVYTLLPVEEEVATIPLRFDLAQNYPNPFNAATTICYQLQAANQISLTIYNILGQRVRKLVDGKQPAGAYKIWWDGTDEDGVRVSSGVYLYRLKTESSTQVRKMVLLK